MQWVELNVGRRLRVSPRDVIGLLEDGLGMPPRVVGIIDLTPGASFAQVPKEYLDVLRDGPRVVETEVQPVEITLVPLTSSDRPKKKKQ